jgi:hypothetical protein
LPRPHVLLACILVVIGTARIISTYRVFNHTIDEPEHFAAGMQYLSTGKYRYEDQHPPLARVFAALGPFLAGERFHSGPDAYREGYRILGRGAQYDRMLALGRVGILPFFWAASAVVYLWALRAGGGWAAVAATLLFTTLPPVLAHSGLMTTDVALCAFAGAAALMSIYWAEQPSPRRSAALGALVALAVVSKFSALVYLPAAWLAMGAGNWRAAPGWAWQHRRALALVGATAALGVWMAYGFSFARVEFLSARLPAPRFWSGLEILWEHNRAGHATYLLGQRSTEGFRHFFPVALSIKTPLGMLALLGAAPWLLRGVKSRRAPAAFAFSAAILLVAMLSRINLGVRHVLPVYIGMAVICGFAIAAAHSRAAKAMVTLLVGWHIVSGAAQHPDYLAYTNEIAGSRPERFVADSDLDWGQDMKRLGAFLSAAGAKRITFAPFNRTYERAGHPFPPTTPGDPDRPSPGWNAVSITMWKVFGHPAWADRIPPHYRIGRSILVWRFPE